MPDMFEAARLRALKASREDSARKNNDSVRMIERLDTAESEKARLQRPVDIGSMPIQRNR